MALWTNLLRQSANIDDTGSPWAGALSNFTVAGSVSVIPGQTAHKWTDDVGQQRFAQDAGTYTGSPETAVLLAEEVDAPRTDWVFRDTTGNDYVAFMRHTWATDDTTVVLSGVGTVVSVGSVDLGAGPTGAALRLLHVTATADTAGNGRSMWCYPSGAPSGASGTSTILHYAGLHEADTFSPAMLVTGSTTPEHRVIDLSDHKVRVRPGESSIDLDHKRRRASGKMSTAKHSDATRARVWRLETVIEDRATGEALQVELNEPGRIQVVHNPIIHHVTGVAAECEARNVRRLDGPLEDHVRLSFELVETRPV